MTCIDTVDMLFQVLRRSRLLDAGQLNEVKLDLLADAHDPQELTQYLTEMEWLTEYQSEQLLQGHDQELVLGSYEILDLVGEGGLCQVFKAWDNDHQRIVALKVVHPELRENREVLEQLRQEIAVLGRLEHPAFIKSYERSWDVSRYYFAMELVEGVDLHRLQKQVGRLPVAQACDYVRQAALGLQYAYEQGLVHRDIKPGNLLVPLEGPQIRILDIGLARLEWDRQDLSATPAPASLTSVMGTPDYIAPEQALNSSQADTRADIYSLGCTLFHLLTGQPPFQGKSLTKKLLDHQQAPPPSIKQVRPELPQALAAVVLKMMAKLPADRYQTPAGVAVAIALYARGNEARLSLEKFRSRRRSFNGRPRKTKTPCPGAAASPSHPATKPAQKTPAVEAVAPRPVPGAMQTERRAAPRRAGNPIPVLVGRFDLGAETLQGWVLNRSTGGLGILLEEPLEVGMLMQIRPSNAPLSTPWAQVRVLHCTPQRSSWCVGFQFAQKLSWGDLRLFG